MVAFLLLLPSAAADPRFYQPGFMAPSSYANTYAAAPEMMYASPEVVPAQYAYPAAYPVYEQEAPENSDWSDMAMLAVAGAVVGAVIGYQAKTEKVSMLGLTAKEEKLVDKVRSSVVAGLVAVGLMATPAIANAADVKLGSDSGQLVFVPDEIKVKVGDSVTWTGNKGLPHNVVFEEENVPDGVDAEALSHADNIGEEGEKVTTKFTKAGTYGYYCEPHRGAGMNGTVIVQ
jgi:plastocyanin